MLGRLKGLDHACNPQCCGWGDAKLHVRKLARYKSVLWQYAYVEVSYWKRANRITWTTFDNYVQIILLTSTGLVETIVAKMRGGVFDQLITATSPVRFLCQKVVQTCTAGNTASSSRAEFDHINMIVTSINYRYSQVRKITITFVCELVERVTQSATSGRTGVFSRLPRHRRCCECAAHVHICVRV